MVQLEDRASIDKIQILVHEDRIPSSIEIQIGDVVGATASPDVKAAKFLSLGVIRMQSERAANHHGRQLQTVELVGGGGAGGGSQSNSNKIKVRDLLLFPTFSFMYQIIG